MNRDIALERGLPANVDAERLILGSILNGALDFGLAAGVLDPDDFSIEKHRRIFARMADLYSHGEHTDRVTVANELTKENQLESVDGYSYLVSLDEGMPAIANLESWLTIIKHKSILRRGAILGHSLYQRCIAAQDDPADVLADAERAIRTLGAQQPEQRQGLRSVGEIVRDFGGINSYAQQHDPGIQTPWRRLNRIIGGFRPGQMITVAGLTGSGKSAFGLQLAYHAAAHENAGAAIFSLEMGGQELFERLACGNAGVDSKKLERCQLTELERFEFGRAASELVSLPLWIDDTTSCTLPAIHAALRKKMHEHPVKLMLVDYLQLVQPVGSRENRTQQVAEISRGMKMIAREYKIPVIVLAQFNRGPAVDRREPQLHDLRESGSIEQDSDKVLFLHPTPTQNGPPPDGLMPVKLIVAKQRNGKARRTIDMFFDETCCRFGEVEKEHASNESEKAAAGVGK